MNNEQLGQLLACLCCLVPWLTGFAMAWTIRPAVLQHGWRGLIPSRIRQWAENIKIKFEEE